MKIAILLLLSTILCCFATHSSALVYTCDGTKNFNAIDGDISVVPALEEYGECSFVIRSANRNKITIKFANISLYSGSNAFDFIQIYDGERDPRNLLVWFSGNVTPPIIVSKGSVLVITFSNSASRRSTYNSQFSLSYSASVCANDCSNHGYCFKSRCYCDVGWTGNTCMNSVCQNNCGGANKGRCEQSTCICTPGNYGADCLQPYCDPLTVFTASTGKFSDHNPSSIVQGYLHNTNCSWLIQPTIPKGFNNVWVTLSFLNINTEYGKDLVTIYDGTSVQSPVLLEISGTSRPRDTIARSGSMLVTFITNMGISSDGFQVEYRTTAANPSTPPTSPTSDDSGLPLALIITLSVAAAVLIVAGGILGTMYLISYLKKRRLYGTSATYAAVLQNDVTSDEEL